jgi:hypothetical protein
MTQILGNLPLTSWAEAMPSKGSLVIGEAVATTRELCEEVSNCLISSALVTSAINILVAHKHTKSIDHIFRYLPGDPVIVTVVTRGRAPSNFDRATLGTLETLFEKVAVGKALVRQCRVFDGQCDDLHSRELGDLLLCWRQVCALGVAALCCLERCCKAFWSAEKLRTLDRLIELLGNARNGESPYVGADGYPLIPHWAEQRRQRRQSVNLGARVYVGSETRDAKVVDISSEGVGLDHVFGLRAGQLVLVEFEGDRQLDGIVTWTAAGRAGIQMVE